MNHPLDDDITMATRTGTVIVARRVFILRRAIAAIALVLSCGSACATVNGGSHGLQAIVDQRLLGDRTGACLAVAVIEQDKVVKTYRCADPKDEGRIGANTAFEIGSISKTMTAALLADLILQGDVSLDDPLASYLPEGTKVPSSDGAPILLRHVVTHTSGLPALPSRLGVTDMRDPYANLTEQALLDSLGDVKLGRAPGEQFEYSNFASMVISYAIARHAGVDFESLLRQKLFAQLGMNSAYVNQIPEGVRAATGHIQNTQTAPAWQFATNLAGVGGVRATLGDMVRYVQGQLGAIESSILPALRFSQQQIADRPPMAMNWMLAPIGGRTVHLHEGGTGGFSSYVAIDISKRRGVVILSDTTWNSLGGLGSLGNHLIDSSLPLGKPRKLESPPLAMLEGLIGEYQLQGAMKMTLRQRDGTLYIQPEGQDEYEMGYDDAGDFFPLLFDAVLRPQKKGDGRYVFTWMQMGALFQAARVDASSVPTLAPELLAAYAGTYSLAPGFDLKVWVRGDKLFAQASGQGEFPLDMTGKDTFEFVMAGIEIAFQRDATDKVTSLDLHQGGRTRRAMRRD